MIFCEPSNEAYHHVLVERAGFLAALGSEAATPSGETARPIKRRGRKPGSGSFDDADALLLIEMKKLITDQKASSPHAAAQIVVEQAKGRGTLESRVARLLKKLMKQNN
jgi:hypothetical protein